MLKEDNSSDSISVHLTETNPSQSSSEQESSKTYSNSSWSTEEEQADITGILMADMQPEFSCPQVSEYESEIVQP
jgi:hypothetical protein